MGLRRAASHGRPTMKGQITLFLIVATTVASSLASAQTAISQAQGRSAVERRALIGPIKDQASQFGCGCGFSFPSDSRKGLSPLIFSSDIDEETAVMNIDGVDMELRLARSTEQKGKERIGSRSTRTYVAAGVRAFAVYVTTRMCKPNDEDCEATDYDATMTVTKGRRKQTIRLKGACGC